jgi:myo-inositol 2-dehydrogenase/D-chiro-inositol 1-dehydrogenase
MRAVRVGLIGYGAWGQHHAHAIAAVPGAGLSAICTRSVEAAAAARRDYPDAAIYQDYRQMLENEDLELCDVVLPSDMHHAVCRAVLESGRHVLLEKPMALTIAHCRDLVDLAAAQGRVLAIGHELRLSSLWGKVKALIDAGAIGDPLYAFIELWRRPYRLGSGGWRYDADRVGSWILEEPIHFFDLARWYFSSAGDPVSVYARANGARGDDLPLHQNFSAMLNFRDSQYAVVSQSLAGWEHHQTAKLTGTTGAMVARWSGVTDRTRESSFSLTLQSGGSVADVPIDRPSGEVYELVDQVAAVVASVRNGTPVPCSGSDGLWAVSMCLEAAASIRSGSAVLFRGA